MTTNKVKYDCPSTPLPTLKGEAEPKLKDYECQQNDMLCKYVEKIADDVREDYQLPTQFDLEQDSGIESNDRESFHDDDLSLSQVKIYFKKLSKLAEAD